MFEFSRHVNGQRRRVRKALPKTWTRAQADAYDRKESARLYAEISGVEKPDRLIEDAVAVYVKERTPKLKHGKNVDGELALIFWVYKGRRISELADVCREYEAKATKEDGDPLAPATIRLRMRYLVAACRYAWKRHDFCDTDPAVKVGLPSVKNDRTRHIDRREMLQICLLCQHRPTRQAIRIAFYSGMRLAEIHRAVLHGDVWFLADTKNGDPRIVPVHPKVAAAARNFRSKSKNTVQAYWARARDAAGVADLHFHDLRHSTASALINAGESLYTVGAVLGHKDGRSTKRYAHLATETLKTAIRRIS
ncbi:tyrosine-type recombinase/integrase [Comamonas serinivorans]|uniref:tyrosine-type recombinase/integrase n=1 Tax=Comamonas serinivorans TaxID=1082851 RepID=UPI001F393854|nr:site-specific integrase [Comamonas serinivorans]